MTTANPTLPMPYPGLRPFEAEDQPLFFGREAQVSGMLRQLEDHRFVAVVGSSGSGKSSLVRAGLLPAVHEGFLLGTTDWLTIIIKPGHQPYQRLVRALHRATRGEGDASAMAADHDPLTPEETATLATLRRTDRGLLTVLGQLAISPESRVMVVVDQFEELFAFRRAGVNRDTVASRDEAAAFVGMLLRTASEPAGRVWAVLTMRSDFIGDCETFLGLPEQISRSQFLVPRPDRGQLEEAIARPADVEEGAFKTFTFEEGLVNRIINEAGDRPDQLPLMQHSLMRTWKRAVARNGPDGPVKVTAEDYEQAGGIEKALSLHADAAWDEIKDDPKKAHIARRLFLLLCDISPDGQITRRRPQMAEVQAVTGASVAEIEQVVRVFQHDDRNFLLPPPPQSLTTESYLDISHEALLRQWRIFAGEWQEQERRDASELRRLAEQASLRKQGQGGLVPTQDLERISRWEKRVSPEWARRYITEDAWRDALCFVEESQAEVKREEEQRQKQARQKRAFVRAVAIILTVATGFAVWQMTRALNAEHSAKIAATEAEKATVAAEKALTRTQDALTKSYLRTIGVAGTDGRSFEEETPLWELAELDSANARVRENVIDGWFRTDEAVRKALNADSRGLRAAAGTDMRLRNYIAPQAKRLAEHWIEAMQDTPSYAAADDLFAGLVAWIDPTDAVSVARRLGTGQRAALAALAARMDTEDATVADLAQRLAEVLARDMYSKFDTYIWFDGGNPYRALGSELAALAPRMSAKEAAKASALLSKALNENPTPSTGGVPDALGTALEGLAARLVREDTVSVADRVVETLEIAKWTELEARANLASALAALAKRLEPEHAAGVAKRGAQVLIEPLKYSGGDLRHEKYGRPAWRKAVRALSGEMDAGGAASVAVALTAALQNAKDAGPDLADLAATLAIVATRMDKDDVAGVAEFLVATLENSTASEVNLSHLGNALAAVVAQMRPTDAPRVAAKGGAVLTKAIGDRARTAESLGGALGALARSMKANDAAVATARPAQVLAEKMAKHQESLLGGGTQIDALAALAAGLNRQDAKEIADLFTTALENPAETDVDYLSFFALGQAAVFGSVDPNDAARGARHTAQIVIRIPKNLKWMSLWALAELANSLDSEDAATIAERLAQALKDHPKETDQLRPEFGIALAALVLRINPEGTTSSAHDSAEPVENRQETNDLNLLLANAARRPASHRISSLRGTKLFALSNIMLNAVSKPPEQGWKQPKDRKQLSVLYAVLGSQDLAEVLKWPFCVGEAQKLALAELEKRTGRNFGGDLWKFVEQAKDLGIKGLDAPAKRPRIEDALKELEALRVSAKKP